jgi:hypothetical protein
MTCLRLFDPRPSSKITHQYRAISKYGALTVDVDRGNRWVYKIFPRSKSLQLTG